MIFSIFFNLIMVSGGPQMSQQDKFAATSKEGIKKIARKVWRQVTPAYLETLYESMPRRMQAVVEAQGGHTKY